MGQTQIGDVRHLYLRILHSEQSLNRSPQEERVSLIVEFGANEKALEDIDAKGAPNSNKKFSKCDVTAENASLPDETPVLQYNFGVCS